MFYKKGFSASRRPRKLRRLRRLQNSDSSDSSTGPSLRSSAPLRRSEWYLYLQRHSAALHFARGSAGAPSFRKRCDWMDFAAVQPLGDVSMETARKGWEAPPKLRLLSLFRLLRDVTLIRRNLYRTTSPNIIATIRIESCIFVSSGGQAPARLTPEQLTPSDGKSANYRRGW